MSDNYNQDNNSRRNFYSSTKRFQNFNCNNSRREEDNINLFKRAQYLKNRDFFRNPKFGAYGEGSFIKKGVNADGLIKRAMDLLNSIKEEKDSHIAAIDTIRVLQMYLDATIEKEAMNDDNIVNNYRTLIGITNSAILLCKGYRIDLKFLTVLIYNIRILISYNVKFGKDLDNKEFKHCVDYLIHNVRQLGNLDLELRNSEGVVVKKLSSFTKEVAYLYDKVKHQSRHY